MSYFAASCDPGDFLETYLVGGDSSKVLFASPITKTMVGTHSFCRHLTSVGSLPASCPSMNLANLDSSSDKEKNYNASKQF